MKNENLNEECAAIFAEVSAQIAEFLRKISGEVEQKKTIAEFQPGEVVEIGGHEMVVLEQMDGSTALILRKLLEDDSIFSYENNNYVESIVDCRCEDFANRIAEAVGEENILSHDVDLTALTGDVGYGKVSRRASLLTLSRYQKYLDVLDKYKPDNYWWLATANSTKRHENNRWILCVSPSGHIFGNLYRYDIGVRPFCILKSDIFVSY